MNNRKANLAPCVCMYYTHTLCAHFVQQCERVKIMQRNWGRGENIAVPTYPTQPFFH